MKKMPLLVTVSVFCIGMSVSGQDKDKQGRQPARALPPHKLDEVFRNATTERQVVDALINDTHFKKAVADALKAKQEAEANFKKPDFVGPYPERAAREAFLKSLRDERREARVR